MALIDRILLFLFFAGVGITGAFEIAATVKSQPELARSESSLCDEVKHELEEHVADGMLDKDSAEDIVKRCFEKFGDLINV